MRGAGKRPAPRDPEPPSPAKSQKKEEEREPGMVDPNVPEHIGRFEDDSDTGSNVSLPSQVTPVPDEEPETAPAVASTSQDTRSILPPASDYVHQSTNLPSDEPADPSEWRTHILEKKRQVPIPTLCWDHDAQYGQVRELHPSVVRYYVQRLLTGGEPVKPVETFVKIQPGVYSFKLSVKYAALRVLKTPPSFHRRSLYDHRGSAYIGGV